MTLYFLNPSSASVNRHGSAEWYLPASAASPSILLLPRRQSPQAPELCPAPGETRRSIHSPERHNSILTALTSQAFFSLKLVQIQFCFYFAFPQGTNLAGVTM